jgi:hypothetical protein
MKNLAASLDGKSCWSARAFMIHKLTRFPGKLHFTILVALFSSFASTAFAQDTWNGTTASWDTAADWSSKAVPGTGVDAIVPGSSNASYTLTFNGSYTAATALSGLSISGYNAYSTTTFTQATNNEMAVSGNEIIGATGSGSLTALATYDQSDGTNAVGGELYLGYVSGSSGDYSLQNGTLSALNEVISYGGIGSFTQTGGTNTVADNFELGATSGLTGTYLLSETGALASGAEYVGFGGSGSFTQSGGSNTITTASSSGFLNVGGGYSAGGGVVTGTGNYALSGGTLAADTENIGYLGTGTFTQTGGSNSVEDLFVGGGFAPANADEMEPFPIGPGSYSLNGDQAILTATNEYIGVNDPRGAAGGDGTFAQMGGSNTVSNSLYVGGGVYPGGDYGSGTGSYSLGGTGSLAAEEEFVGCTEGTFTQTGGSNTITDTLYVGGVDDNGEAFAGTGAYSLQNGTLSTSSEIIGYAGMGSFTQTGGTNTVSGILYVGGLVDDNGNQIGGTGSYALSGTGTVLSASYETIGYTGTGSFNQTGGSNTISNELYVGGGFDNEGSPVAGTGSYSLSGAGATLSALYESIGYTSSGTFSQTGGTNTITDDLYVGAVTSVSTTSSYSLGGNGILSAGVEEIGFTGPGTFTQSGGTNTVSGTLYVGGGVDTDNYPLGGTGSYALSGTGAILNATNEYVGFIATGTAPMTGGTFTQTGGTNTISGALYIGGGIDSQGYATSGTGSYSLSGDGSQLSAATEYVGYSGSAISGQFNGSFDQTGGSNTVSGTLYIGQDYMGYQNFGATGSYSLSGTGSLSAENEIIGNTSSGSFVQNGGTNTIGGTLTLGQGDTGTTANYSLQGGSLAAANEDLAYGGATDNFTQSGGTNTVSQQLTIEGASNSYTLDTSQNAALQAAVEVIDIEGTFTQYSGTNTVTSFLQLDEAGTYNLSGGILNAQQESIGSAGSEGFLSQSGGTNSIGSGGNLTITSGYYSFYGGVLNAPDSPGGFVTLPTAEFQMSETSTENGYLQNFGTFIYYGGTFNGTLENDNIVDLYAPFTAAGGVINNSLISIAAGSSLYGGGTPGFDNEGELDFANGAIGGTNTLNDGLISGYGTIDGGNFANYGLVTQGAGNLILSATGINQNFGTINLAAGRQFRLTGSDLVNNGGLNLEGGIVTGTAELDNSAGGVVTGSGSILSPFANETGGTVELAAGTLNISQAFTNAGVISFTGATASLSGGGVTNNGTIQGVGNEGSATLTNNGIIEALGGTLGVNGTLTNSANGEILAGVGDKVLVTNGLSANAGVINLTGGTFDNNGHALTNNGEVSGYGTFRSGGLTNNDSITFTGGQTTVNGNVTNENGGTITAAYNAVTFTGNVTNDAGATFKTISTNATFAGTFTNNGSYVSDPSTQNFVNFVTGATGTVSSGPGDIFNVSGNVSNTSTQNLSFNMSQAQLTLQGTVNHQFTWAGSNLGASSAGYSNNFAIGTFELESGGSLTLTSGDGIYVSTLELDSVLDNSTEAERLAALGQIDTTITGNGADIYYDPSQASNAYLEDGTYALADGGYIEAAPEPGTWALFAAGFGMLLVFCRIKHGEKRCYHFIKSTLAGIPSRLA